MTLDEAYALGLIPHHIHYTTIGGICIKCVLFPVVYNGAESVRSATAPSERRSNRVRSASMTHGVASRLDSDDMHRDYPNLGATDA